MHLKTLVLLATIAMISGCATAPPAPPDSVKHSSCCVAEAALPLNPLPAADIELEFVETTAHADLGYGPAPAARYRVAELRGAEIELVGLFSLRGIVFGGDSKRRVIDFVALYLDDSGARIAPPFKPECSIRERSSLHRIPFVLSCRSRVPERAASIVVSSDPKTREAEQTKPRAAPAFQMMAQGVLLSSPARVEPLDYRSKPYGEYSLRRFDAGASSNRSPP